ncbi:hypothetical protein PR202_ga00341 [Eleusine coracana subsp. coracana]|uniref:KIB1-4 beta-propeller domain-containing protein n=1 Tax=Eleusine coracana subsp. coracana TaxID=191504 RepID=A0AAV5BFH1_ELECO|nr:hypothetical protein PR202_ga00341 [Eleusine coracana subsp. coracana]
MFQARSAGCSVLMTRWWDLRDIALYDGKVHAVDASGDLYAMALDEQGTAYNGEPMVSWGNRVVTAAARRCTTPATRYLVVSGGRLLMVHRVLMLAAESEFTVFKADLASSRWVNVPSVGGDTALFVGRWGSVARRVSRFSMPGNMIHFLDDDELWLRNGDRRRGHFGSYDMVHGKTIPLLSSTELRSSGDAPATWLFHSKTGGSGSNRSSCLARTFDPRLDPDPPIRTPYNNDVHLGSYFLQGAGRRRVVSWHDLPLDVLAHVFRLITLRHDDPGHFVETCRDWQASVQRMKPAPRVACLALPDGKILEYPDLKRSRRFSNIAEFRGAACDGWLILCEDDEGLGPLCLTNPFNGKMRHLPSLLSIRNRDEPIEMDSWLPRAGKPCWDDDWELISVQKLVVCADGLIAALVGRDSLTKVAVCSLESFAWSVSAHDKWRRYEDLAFSGGRLYALTSGEDLIAFNIAVDAATGEAAIAGVKLVARSAGCSVLMTRWWDLRDIALYDGKVHAVDASGDLYAMALDEQGTAYNGEPMVSWGNRVVTAAARRCTTPATRYLVVSGGRLLMVHRVLMLAAESEFTVFKADLASSRWVNVPSVGGDTALFVGRWGSVARRVSRFSMPGNMIHFLDDDELWLRNGDRRRGHFGSYDMVHGKTIPLLSSTELRSSGDAPATWLFHKPESGAVRGEPFPDPTTPRVKQVDQVQTAPHAWREPSIPGLILILQYVLHTTTTSIWVLIFCREQDGGVLSWHDLPLDVLAHVFRLITLRHDDPGHFVETCRDWQASVQRMKPAPRVACLALPDGKILEYPDLKRSRRFSNIAEFRGAACDGWLILCEDDEGLGPLCLTNPFNGKMRHLPSLLSIRNRDEPIEMDSWLPRAGKPCWDDDWELISVQKLVVCADGLIAALVGRDSLTKVAVCSLESFAWSVSAHDKWRRYEDLAFSGGRLYALTSGEDLIAFNIAVDAATGEAAIAGVKLVVSGFSATACYDLNIVVVHYLVASSRAGDELLMVRRLFPPSSWDEAMTLQFAVLRADLASSSSPPRWVEVSTLDGEALFLGQQCSRAVAPIPRVVRGDQIFFLRDDCLSMSIWDDRGRSRPLPSPYYHTAVYDMQTGTVTDMLPRKLKSNCPVPATWLFRPDDNVTGVR